jgi:hypothetical protein
MGLDTPFYRHLPSGVAFYAFVYQPYVNPGMVTVHPELFAAIKRHFFIAFAALSYNSWGVGRDNGPSHGFHVHHPDNRKPRGRRTHPKKSFRNKNARKPRMLLM